MNSFELIFYGVSPELTRTRFIHGAHGGDSLRCTRGKEGKGFRENGSFQWTKAVKALSLLSVQHKLTNLGSPFGAYLSGERGSYAAALDNAIHKKCVWLQDMFGTDSKGELIALRLMKRSNPGLRRPGPCYLSFLPSALEPEAITIIWKDYQIENQSELIEFARLLGPITLYEKPTLRLITNGVKS